MNAVISARPAVALGELVARVLRQRLHARADAALRVADALQDLVHPRVQLARSSRRPISWISSGDMVVVVDAFSAQR